MPGECPTRRRQILNSVPTRARVEPLVGDVMSLGGLKFEFNRNVSGTLRSYHRANGCCGTPTEPGIIEIRPRDRRMWWLFHSYQFGPILTKITPQAVSDTDRGKAAICFHVVD